MEFLLFTLYGVFQSWGNELAVGNRTTDSYPTKSGITGFLGSCLGINRNTPEILELSESIGFSCRVDQEGTLLYDYQTISIEGKTTEAEKHYLQGAVFTVCLWKTKENGISLQKICGALRQPRYIPYLGRKCCPICCPLMERIVVSKNLKEAYEVYSIPNMGLPTLLDQRRVFWEGSDTSIKAVKQKYRRDQLIMNRSFRNRLEFEGILEVC